VPGGGDQPTAPPPVREHEAGGGATALAEYSRQYQLARSAGYESTFQEFVRQVGLGDAETTASMPQGPVGTDAAEDPGAIESSVLTENYRLQAYIGHGGMGHVWRARQLSTGREVAVKLLGERFLASPERRRQFDNEVKLAAALEHPGIARIYDSGLHRNTYFYVMEFIDGCTLGEYCQGQPVRKILELIAEICDAVGYAHRNRVIHHDIKPGNIMVVKATNRPLVLDFGLARTQTVDTGEPEHVEPLRGGTLGYMPPEQARGERSGPPADVYALGATAIRLLTGRFVYDVPGDMAAAYEVIKAAPEPRIGAIAWSGDGDLQLVLRKATHPDPSLRYSTAAELAADLRAVLSSSPIGARPATLPYVARKFVNRRPGVTALLAGVAIVLAVTACWYVVTLTQERDRTAAAHSGAIDRAITTVDQLLGFALDRPPAPGSPEYLRLVRASEELDQLAQSGISTGDPSMWARGARVRLILAEVYAIQGDLQGTTANLTAVIGETPELQPTPETVRLRAVARARLALEHSRRGFPEGREVAQSLLAVALGDTAGVGPNSPAQEQMDRARVLLSQWHISRATGDAAGENAAALKITQLPAAKEVAAMMASPSGR
jgi:predicted Ser/Thr protein kinase